MLRLLWDFAQWRGDVLPQRNPIELVHRLARRNVVCMDSGLQATGSAILRL